RPRPRATTRGRPPAHPREAHLPADRRPTRLRRQEHLPGMDARRGRPRSAASPSPRGVPRRAAGQPRHRHRRPHAQGDQRRRPRERGPGQAVRPPGQAPRPVRPRQGQRHRHRRDDRPRQATRRRDRRPGPDMTAADLDAKLAGLPPEALELLEAELAARLWRKRWDRWTPYPWQVPPEHIPTLGWWLQLGGRGTGKTDGCARYMVAHVNGPPCDPRLNGGHRMAIIAPTQGDAVEACVNGPSGLKAHDPRVVLRTTAGGTFARWPNGAEAKLFGAHTPDDIERLRAGGNRCLVWVEEVAAQRRLKDA